MEYKKQITEGLRSLVENPNSVWVVTLMQQDSRYQMKTFAVKPLPSREAAHKFIDDHNAVPEVFQAPKDRNIIYYNIRVRDRKHYS